MSDLPCETAGFLASHGDDGTNNGILVAFWNIGASEVNAREEQLWIWRIWSEGSLFVLFERRCNPTWRDNRKQVFACDVILGEVRSRRDYMCDFSNCNSTIMIEFVYFCSILFEYSSKLYYMSEGFNMTGEVLTSRALSIVSSLLNTIET